MFFKYFILITFLICVSNDAISQYLDLAWPLGYDSPPKANLNFSTGTLIIDTVSRDLRITETSASISDSLGKIIALSNGCYITNVLNDTMMNGDNLNPGSCNSTYCGWGGIIVQGEMILPDPANQNQFILCHETCDYSNGGNPIALYTSTIDFSFDSGKGAVINKNTILYSGPLCNGNLDAVKHANGRDWWILLHKRFTNECVVFLLDTLGISGPFIQAIGPVFDSVGYGTSCFSPDGRWYCTTTLLGDLHLFNFNRCNGLLSNYQYINMADSNGSYVAFSPSSNFLYLINTLHIYQYNVNNITTNPFLLASFDGYISLGQPTVFGLPQLAIDHKIYIACGGGQPVMHVINNPDSFGFAADVQQHSVQLPCFSANVPSLPNYRLGPLSIAVCDSLNTISGMNNDNIIIYPNPVSNYLHVENSNWKNGSKLTISIFNCFAQEIIQQSWLTGSNVDIDVSTLVNGIYIMQITSKGLVYRNKFVKSGQ
jgi:hypothetical protein